MLRETTPDLVDEVKQHLDEELKKDAAKFPPWKKLHPKLFDLLLLEAVGRCHDIYPTVSSKRTRQQETTSDAPPGHPLPPLKSPEGLSFHHRYTRYRKC